MLPINDLYPAIQGEGVYAGTPMVLVRLQGCDVGCPFCDTKETWNIAQDHPELIRIEPENAFGVTPHFAWVSEETLVTKIQEIRETFPTPWVLVTGGEPALHDLRRLVFDLHNADLKVALETSGTEKIQGDFDWVCVSPKINMPGGKEVLDIAVLRADELKFVVGRERDLEVIDQFLSTMGWSEKIPSSLTISLQPMSLSEKATALCLKTIQERGWRLSLQIHKFLKLK